MNYNLRIALRHLKKDKTVSGLNILGLAIGLAACLLLGAYMYRELHYDRDFVRHEDIYLLGSRFTGQQEQSYFYSPAAMGPALKENFPAVESYARAIRLTGPKTTLSLPAADGTEKTFSVPAGFMADPDWFQIFSFPFKEGDPARALREPGSIVLSENIANQLFGNTPALNRIVRFSDNWWLTNQTLDCKVTGVFRKTAGPSHLDAEFYVPTSTGAMPDFMKQSTSLVRNNMFFTYLLLKPHTDAAKLQADAQAFMEKQSAVELSGMSWRKQQFMTRLDAVHQSGIESATPAANPLYLRILGSIALFTLLIAIVNFVNISTARATRRMTEVGVRKSLGADRFTLARQFLSEQVVSVVVAAGLAWAMAAAALPFMQELTGKAFGLAEYPEIPIFFAGLALLSALLAGLYPALYLSGFRPIPALKKRPMPQSSAAFWRKGLVVFQFGIATALLVASTVVYQQMQYFQTQNLGFEQAQQVVIPLNGPAAMNARPALETALAADTRVAGVASSKFYPGIFHASDINLFRQTQTSADATGVQLNQVNTGFIPTLGLHLLAGRNFDGASQQDFMTSLILNETAVRKLGFTSPEAAIGQSLFWRSPENRYRIIGVMADFHVNSLHQNIEPFGMQYWGDQAAYSYMIVHLKPGDMRAALAMLGQKWQQLLPGQPFEYSFLDADFQKNYASDQQMASLVGIFTALAILISCFGLFGLAAFAAETRTKEIGIRKVLGASVQGITGLLAADFLKLVSLGLVLAAPVAWYAMQRWLQNFAYHIDLKTWMLLPAALAAIAVAALTVSFQSIKAALANPVKSLRSE
jgi:putative ABC transport system permease protein